ncbi:hypothetical protein Baya_5365 [Bagarius yarrelli]|uniref:Uncharacterized protein n=1 Tax=Bagarius yarrelli TaxID=175774 RepID=A0A556TWL4_BAGYA|nr:hypothetical protein Baya_5365 [Bagarius yarrelli]
MGRKAQTFRNGSGVVSYTPTPDLSLTNRLTEFTPARGGETILCKPLHSACKIGQICVPGFRWCDEAMRGQEVTEKIRSVTSNAAGAGPPLGENNSPVFKRSIALFNNAVSLCH